MCLYAVCMIVKNVPLQEFSFENMKLLILCREARQHQNDVINDVHSVGNDDNSRNFHAHIYACIYLYTYILLDVICSHNTLT